MTKNNPGKIMHPPPLWSGREDAPPGLKTRRWHHLARVFTENPVMHDGIGGFTFIGYPTDTGIRANHGRPGAKRGPFEIRRWLGNLPVPRSMNINLYDAGDVMCRGLAVAAQQKALAVKVSTVLASGLTPIVLGGGHDLAYGHYLGIIGGLRGKTGSGGKRRRLGIVNFDAHFDLRPVTDRPNSGTPFTQILHHARSGRAPVSYLCLGIQPSANTALLFDNAKRLGAQFITAEEIGVVPSAAIARKLRLFIAGCDAIYPTFCLDVIAAAFAPGVSAPTAVGLLPTTAIALMKMIVASGKVIAFDVAELSPPLDQDHRTARLAAQIIFDFITSLQPPPRSSR